MMLIVMLTLLMLQLQSFSRCPGAPHRAARLIGASLGLNVANQPFGFVALLGLIALAGMIMRNSVILVDQIETDVPHGLTRGRHRRGDGPARPAGGADGAGRDPGDDPAVAFGVLGPDGDHHHGRFVRGNLPDSAVPAGPLCPVVPQEPGGKRQG